MRYENETLLEWVLRYIDKRLYVYAEPLDEFYRR